MKKPTKAGVKAGKAAKPLIGFIGQGWIGKNYSDDFERRGYTVVRYGLEKPYALNKDRIKDCDIVFIAVPTPTTPKGFDSSILAQAVGLVGKGKIVVIKSTLIMGTTRKIQKAYSDRTVLVSPEFLSESTAAYDAAHPDRNVIGLSVDDGAHRAAAERVLAVLPHAPYQLVCSSDEAEFIKYSHNIHGYISVVFSNLLYDIALAHDMDWDMLKAAFKADPMISSHRYLNPIHKSGRGAGGHCFIKDFEAFLAFFRDNMSDAEGAAMLEAIRNKNLHLLRSTRKDADLVEGVYGPGVAANPAGKRRIAEPRRSTARRPIARTSAMRRS